MSGRPAVVWFRRDLRLADNRALTAAAASGAPILPVYVLDEETDGLRPPGGAARWWLHHSLTALAASLAARGLPLVLRCGAAEREIVGLAAACYAGSVHWNRDHEPAARARDDRIERRLAANGVAVGCHRGALLREPGEVTSRAGTPLSVFTPYHKAFQRLGEPDAPLPALPRCPPAPALPGGDTLADWRLLPVAPDWSGGLADSWSPGEAGAARRLEAFLEDGMAGHAAGRDLPGEAGVSRLSPHLHWGEISPSQVWHATATAAVAAGIGVDAPGPAAFLKELVWREFSASLLFNNPGMADAPIRAAFAAFPWADDPAGLAAWQRGLTGYPLVDAGMRELWSTGWMHNRARMVTASFLVKHLLVDWRLGERWFWDTLVDADLASNTANWQWVAGCGADAAPYFRIFNPVAQGERFDADGRYVRRWVPELADVPPALVHRPWEAPRLPGGYPTPIIDHRFARERALAAFATIRRPD